MGSIVQIAGTPPLVRTLEAMVASFGPRHWYRGDTYTRSGANLATMLNRGSGGGLLSVALGTLGEPTPNSAFNGARAVPFTGSQRLASSLPLADWKFLGSESECSVVYQRGSTGAEVAMATTSGSNGYRLGGSSVAAVAMAVSGAQWTAGAKQVGIPQQATAVYGLTAPFRGTLAYQHAAVSVTQVNATAGLADPDYTLSVGAAVDGAWPLAGPLAEILIFDRRLSAFERQIVALYRQAMFGLTAPAVSALDMKLLALEPLSWLRTDYFAEVGGKATAFLDKALLGHSFAQSVSASQIPTPLPHAAFGGATVGTFGSVDDQYYSSTLPNSAWTRLHTQSHTIYAAQRATEAWYNPIVSTGNSGGAYRGVYLAAHYGNARSMIGNASGTQQASALTPMTLNTAAVMRSRYVHNSQLAVRAMGTTVAAVPVGDSSPLDPNTTLILGGYVSYAVHFRGQIADVPIFDRALTDADDAIVMDYFANQYPGIAA